MKRAPDCPERKRPVTKLYLIRHAEAEGNLYRIAQGQYNSIITDRGWRQIRALERRFQDIHVDAVYASDLYRTQITARAIWLPKALPLHLEPSFREIRLGVWEDQTWQELRNRYPEEMDHFSSRLDLWRAEGAETAQQLVDRFIPALRRVAEARGLDIATVRHLVDSLTQKPWLGLFGTEKVNVLRLNVALEELNEN